MRLSFLFVTVILAVTLVSAISTAKHSSTKHSSSAAHHPSLRRHAPAASKKHIADFEKLDEEKEVDAEEDAGDAVAEVKDEPDAEEKPVVAKKAETQEKKTESKKTADKAEAKEAKKTEAKKVEKAEKPAKAEKKAEKVAKSEAEPEAKSSTENAEEIMKQLDSNIASVLSDMDHLKQDIDHVKEMEEQVRKLVNVGGSTASKDTPQSLDAEEEEEEKPKLYGEELGNDDDDVALLELENIADDMNGGMDDDDNMAPSLMMERMNHHNLMQMRGDGPGPKTFGVTGDGTRRTFDILEDGSTVFNPAGDSSPEALVIGDESDLKAPVNTSLSSTSEKDLVCVCKRSGAPRGEDRVRCKRHPTPTPEPTPLPPVDDRPGVIQCTNGTWPKNSGPDSNTRDIICVYFPVRVPTPTPPPPVPSPSPRPTEDLPPECYDPRNEYVAPHVEKLPFSNLLIEQGYEVCGC